MARMRRKRCEECEDLFEFVPIGDEVEAGWRERVASGGLVLLKGVVFGVVVGLLIPFLSYKLANILNLHIYTNPYATGILLLAVGILEMLAFDRIQRSATDYLDWKQKMANQPATSKRQPRSSLPVAPASTWLSQVTPREYRAYLRRREYIRERSAIEPVDTFDDALSQSSMSQKSATQKTMSGSVTVSIREPIKCKICLRRTCVDKEHVIAASMRADDAQSVASGVTGIYQREQITCHGDVLKGGFFTGTLLEVAKRTLTFTAIHQLTLLLSLLLPYRLGVYVLGNVDRFVCELVRVTVSVTHYFYPHVPLNVNITSNINTVVTSILNEHIARLAVGSVMTFALITALKHVNLNITNPLTDNYLHCAMCAFKLALEYSVLPWMCGRGSIARGALLIRTYLVVSGQVKENVRSGLLWWCHPVCPLWDSEHAVGFVVVEQFGLWRYLPIVLISASLPVVDYGLPWYLILALAVSDKTMHHLYSHLTTTTRLTTVLKHTSQTMSRHLALSSILHGGRHPQEEQFPSKGRYSFAPHHLKRVTVSKVWAMCKQPVEPQDVATMGGAGGRFKGFTVVYLPSLWVARMAVYLGVVCGLAVGGAFAVWRVPLLVGAYVLGEQTTDKYVCWAVGYALALGSLLLCQLLHVYQALIMRMAVSLFKAIKMISFHGIVNPLLMGMIVKHAHPVDGKLMTLFGYWKGGLYFWVSLLVISEKVRRSPCKTGLLLLYFVPILHYYYLLDC